MGIGEEEQMLIGWKEIARFCGLEVDALKKRFLRMGLRLPKLHSRGRTSSVYAFKSTLEALKPGILRDNRKRA